jgi:isopentenyl-diphosphate delta-isomerase type 1
VTQQLILVDEQDNRLGYASRDACHRWPGQLHRAIALVIRHARGDLLMQRRRSGLWDGSWDITGATHPLHTPEGDESYRQSAERCLRVEWGVEVPLSCDFAFVYAARHGDRGERERCVLYTGRHDGPVRLDPAHGYEYRWCALDEARRLEPMTPWGAIVLERLAGRRS